VAQVRTAPPGGWWSATAGWIAAMDENEHLDLAVDMVNQQEVTT